MGWLLLLIAVNTLSVPPPLRPDDPLLQVRPEEDPPAAAGGEKPAFRPPLDIPMVLSGNFGEIRSNHFHSGIDIKTQGKTGHRIYAIDKGYVSRIKVQANGYGKSIYLAHPGGYTSVYGHLDRYPDDIAEYVRNVQYNRRSHVVDIYPDAGAIPVEKGRVIGYSGNTGSSSGPHLHFEIRRTADQHPTNVLSYGFEVLDRIPPRFSTLLIYPIRHGGLVNSGGGTVAVDLVRDGGKYTVPYGTVLRASGQIGISVEAFDLLNGAYNRCGIYTLEMYVDGVRKYRHVMDEFSFPETRYVNARIHYGEKERAGITAHRLHRLPNDRLRLYEQLVDNGVITVDRERDYQILIVATDVAGNRSELSFLLAGEKPGEILPVLPEDYIRTMDWRVPNRYETSDMKLLIPANALYQETDFTFDASRASSGLLSQIFHIHRHGTPLHLPATLSIRDTARAGIATAKRLIVLLDSDGNMEPAGGEYAEGYLTTRIRSFGNYAIYFDTVAPEITPRNWVAGSDIKGSNYLQFNILDNLSGIREYEGYIDNRWVLFEYDPKSDLLSCNLEGSGISQGSTHELELYVTDEQRNVNLFHSTFIW